MTDWLQGEVIENRRWTDLLFSLRIRASPYGFIPGQFIKLALDVDGERIGRPYSLVNAPGEPLTECYLNRVDEGPLSPRLQALGPGDKVFIGQPPSGFFVLEEVPDGDSLWLLATGTGIGPYLSMLQSDAPWRRFARINMVHSVRFHDELVYRDLILGFQQAHPDRFAFQAVVTREDYPGALDQRLDVLIGNHQLEKALNSRLDGGAQVMLCGNPDMIRDCQAVLQSRGLKKNLRRSPGQVTVERYWH